MTVPSDASLQVHFFKEIVYNDANRRKIWTSLQITSGNFMYTKQSAGPCYHCLKGSPSQASDGFAAIV